MDKKTFINSVWVYNHTKRRFEFDCKTYEDNGSWYWLHNNEYIRDVDNREFKFMINYLKEVYYEQT